MWSELVLLVFLGWLLRTFVSRIYRYLVERVDRKVPDHLPKSAGDWILEKAFPLGIRVVETSSDEQAIDAYFPSAKTIVLSSRVYEKRDPSFWAMAAHEFGHSVVHRASFLVRFPLSLARIVQTSATELATLLILANFLYRRADLDRLAFALLWVSLGAYVLEMVDEAAASSIAVRMLAREEAIGRSDMVAAITALVAAFMTYVAGFVGQTLLVLERDFVASKIERGRSFAHAMPLGSKRQFWLVVVCVVLVALSLVDLARAVKRPDHASHEDLKRAEARAGWRDLLRGVLGMCAVWMVWDRVGGPWLPLVCVVGIVASRSVVRFVASLATGLVQAIVIFAFGLVLIAAVLLGFRPKSREKAEEQAAPARTLGIGMHHLELELANDPPWYVRAGALLFPALHVAFVVGLFLQLSGAR